MEAAQPTESNAWSPEAAARERTERETGRTSRTAHTRASEQQAAKEWVREHQDVALIAAFALGVFMGVWMKG